MIFWVENSIMAPVFPFFFFFPFLTRAIPDHHLVHPLFFFPS